MSEDARQIRVAIYLRVSTDDQVERYGLPMQLESIMALIKSKGQLSDGRDKYVFAGEQYLYQDDGISGTTPIEERPSFARLIEDITNAPLGSRPFDAVAVYKIDRFARKLKILMDVLDFFEDQELMMMSANESIDTSTAFGRAILGIIGVIAELEIETFKQRSQDGRRQAIKRGVYMGEHPPFGYKKNLEKSLETVPEEVEVVKEIFNLFNKEFKTVQSIATYLTNSQVPTPSVSAVIHKKKRGESRKKTPSTFWREKQVRDILCNEIYTGIYFYGKNINGKRVAKEEWKKSEYIFPTIIENADYILAQKRLDSSRARAITARRSEDNQHVYLLSGLLKCESCVEQGRTGEMPSWIGEPKKKGTSTDPKKVLHYYRCGRRSAKKYQTVCNVTTLPAEKIEQIVINQVFELLDNPQAVINYQNKLKSQLLFIKDLKKKRSNFTRLINSSQNRKIRIKEQHEGGYISTEELKQKIDELDAHTIIYKQKIEELQIQISKMILSEHYLNTFEYFRKKYADTLTDIKTDRKFLHDLLETMLDKVVVKSRLVTPKDRIAGKKKSIQYIPYKLDLFFRLPQDMLQEAFFKFGVKDADL